MTPRINACIEGADNPENAGKICCIEYITEEMVVTEAKLNEELAVQLMAIGAEEVDVVDEDWLSGVSCNPDEPEMCESCQ